MIVIRKHRKLGKLVDEIFSQSDAQKMSWAKLARKAGLCPTTVSRLGNCVTRFPRAQTVFDLAAAAGIKIEFDGT